MILTIEITNCSPHYYYFKKAGRDVNNGSCLLRATWYFVIHWHSVGFKYQFDQHCPSKSILSLIILIQDASLRCNLSPKIDSIAFSIVPNSVRLGICICCCCLVVKLYLTLYVPMDCSRPGSSVHGESSGKNAGVSCHAFHQWIFPAQRLNPCLISPALGGRFSTTQSLQKPWNPLRTCINSLSSIIGAKNTNKRAKNLLSMPMLS